MTRRIFSGALSAEIAAAAGRADERQRLALLQRAAKGMLALIREGLIRDGAVRLHQFGTFRLKPVAARKGINPRTGEPLVIPAHRRIVFTPAKALLDRIEPVHPTPVALPAAEPAPDILALGGARPGPPPAGVVGVPLPEAPADTRQPQRHWMAAAAILAAVAMLIIPLLPDPEPPTQSEAPLPASEPATPGSAPQSPPAAAPGPEAGLPVAGDTRPPAREAHRDAATGAGETPPAPPQTASTSAATAATAARPTPPAMPQSQRDLPLAATAEAPAEQAPKTPRAAGTAAATSRPQPAPSIASSPAATAALTGPETPTPAAETARPFFAERGYTVRAGDNLWRLADRHYREPILWPHIYRANSTRVTDPDLIYIGKGLTLPELQGPPERLSARDRELIAEGYYRVYRFYEAQRHPDAIYALIGVRWFDPAVYARHRDDLSPQRLRIMELSPLYGDRVPRLLAVTFGR